MVSPGPDRADAVATLEFEVTGADLTELRDSAIATAVRFAGPRPFQIDTVNAYPAAATNDGRIRNWRGEITATIYPQETR
jgi:hypothetical protein